LSQHDPTLSGHITSSLSGGQVGDCVGSDVVGAGVVGMWVGGAVGVDDGVDVCGAAVGEGEGSAVGDDEDGL